MKFLSCPCNVVVKSEILKIAPSRVYPNRSNLVTVLFFPRALIELLAVYKKTGKCYFK